MMGFDFSCRCRCLCRSSGVSSASSRSIRYRSVAEPLLGNLTFVGDMQVMKFASGMSHITNLGNTISKTGFVATKVQPDEVDQLMSLGAAAIITKPFEPLELVQRLRGIWEEFHHA